MNSKTLIASLWLLASLCLAGRVLADTPIYKWVDEQGRVHYSTEPHGDKAQQLAVQNQGVDPTQAATGAPAPSTAASAQQQRDTKLVQAQQSDSPACKAGRDRLAKYLQADKLFKVDDKGNQVPLSADDKQKALDDARAYVDQTCGGGGT